MMLAAVDAAGLGSLTWVEIALVVFFAIFVLIVISVLFRKRGHFDRAAQIPLNGEAHSNRRTSRGEGDDS